MACQCQQPQIAGNRPATPRQQDDDDDDDEELTQPLFNTIKS